MFNDFAYKKDVGDVTAIGELVLVTPEYIFDERRYG